MSSKSQSGSVLEIKILPVSQLWPLIYFKLAISD